MPRVARRSPSQAHIARTCLQRCSSRDESCSTILYVYLHLNRGTVKCACQTARVIDPSELESTPRDVTAQELTAEVTGVRWSVPDGDFAVLDARTADDGDDI